MEIWVKYRVLLVALLALGGAMVVPEGEAAPVAAENREAMVKQYLQKAHDLEREGRSREAISYLDSAEKLGCDRPMVYWLRGECLQAIKMHEQAIVQYKKAMARAQALHLPDRLTWYLPSKARSEAALGHDDQAIADYTRAIELKSRNAQVFASRGDLYLKQKKYQMAVDDYSSALRVRVVIENKGRILLNRALAYEKLGKPHMAQMDRLKVRQIAQDCDLEK